MFIFDLGYLVLFDHLIKKIYIYIYLLEGLLLLNGPYLLMSGPVAPKTGAETAEILDPVKSWNQFAWTGSLNGVRY